MEQSKEQIEQLVSAEFRRAFEADDQDDMGSRLEDAREAASKLVPSGVTGTFDDETLTFTVD